jgi:hypothetical protein
MPRITDLRPRRGTASQWTSANPVLAAGEMALETDTRQLKFGDGTTTWTSLPYAGAPGGAHTHVASEISDSTVTGRAVLTAADAPSARAAIGMSNVDNTSDASKPISTATQTALNAKVDDSEKGAANGVATLDADGFVPFNQQKSVLRTATISITSANGGTNAVTWPAGHFSQIPVVMISKNNASLAKYIPYATNVTTSGCTIGIYSGDGTTATGSVVLQVLAMPTS